jgi:integrase
MPWTEQLPSGKHRALYRDRDGKRRSAGTFDHKKRAENAAAVAEAEARKIGWRDPSAGLTTWAEWCIAWWPTRGVEPGTAKRDASRRDLHLMPQWANTALVDITRHDVKAWAAALAATGLSPSTVQRCLSLLSASLAAAIDAEIIALNPAQRIRIAQGQTISDRYLTRDEFGALLDQARNKFDAALISLLAGTGLRWGEGVGIQLPRLDMASANLRVADVWDESMRQVKAYPKGKKVRDVPVPEWVLERVTPLVGERRTGFLFDVAGSPPHASNWHRRAWAPMVARSGVGHVRIHDLRHTYASWLIQSGLPLAEVGRLLGHVSPLTTQRYAHLADRPTAHILRALPDPSRGADVGQTDATNRYTPLRLAAGNSAELQG